MLPTMRVLLVDDDSETLELLSRALVREGHQVESAATVALARTIVASKSFDVMVFDVMLPDGSGLDLCRLVRSDGATTPILFLSAQGSVGAKVDGLDAGADDYLAKPFAVRELLARVQALGRRGASLRPQLVTHGALRFDFAARRVERDGAEVPLTSREWDVLIALASRRGRAMSFDDLLEAAWGESTEAARASLEVIVARLRRKLDEAGTDGSIIKTMRGFGYSLSIAMP